MTKILRQAIGIVLLVGAAASTQAHGRNLATRVGAGLLIQDLNGLASISLRYLPDLHYSVGFSAGFDTGATGYSTIGVRVNRYVDIQENLNAYLGVAAYYLSRAAAAVTTRGYQLDALLGVEAFLPGLNDLGISFETGIGYRSFAGTSLRTVGNGFLGTAIHYYF